MRHLNSSIFIAAGLLTGFGIAGAGLVAVTQQGTAERIAQNEREALLANIAKILPADVANNDLLADTVTVSAPQQLGARQTTVYRGRRDGEPSAAVFSAVEAGGYAGPIRLIVGVRADGTLGGVRVLSHRETPGLGDRIEESRSDWVAGFDGKSLTNPPAEDWKVKRDGGEFDQFTGATVTPRAVVKAVKQTLEYAREHWGELFAANGDTAQTG
ncbi:MAG: electron transport complex subunit RsxG [Gammaproteobacteria bacterium]|jgi:electron transport complex protein RnfG